MYFITGSETCVTCFASDLAGGTTVASGSQHGERGLASSQARSCEQRPRRQATVPER
jgi:hypothetical protein